MNVNWGQHTWEEIREYAREGALAVAPFGSTEQHGPMLPLDTDIHIAERVAVSGAKRAWDTFEIPALVLPVMPVGLASHHMRFAGTLTFQPETYITVVSEVLSSAVEHGFRKIAVISGHGGNVPGLQLGIKKVVHQYRDDFTLRIALYQGHQDAEMQRMRKEVMEGQPSEGQLAIHASRSETSETLADRPHLVRRKRMVRPELKVDSKPEWAWQTHELSETGAFGDPSMASAELGEKLWDSWAEPVALFLKRLWDEPLD
jgi:creatinine amidohydrolase